MTSKAEIVILLALLIIGSSGCNRASREQTSKALVREAGELMTRDTQVTRQWVDEFVKVFTPENRAKFPANRDFLRTHAAQIIKSLDESSSLNNRAAEKYEQAAALFSNDQLRRGFASFASAFRQTAEANELIKAQMKMVSDETIADEKTFNEKFLQSWELVKQKRQESEQHIAEGKRLLGW